MMNSKQRVHAVIKREPVDRVPVYMWFHPETTKRLAQELDIRPCQVATAFGDDVRQAWVGNNHAMEGIVHDRDGEGHADPWGISWVKDGPFNQIETSPLQNADMHEIDAYRFPHEHIPELVRNMDGVGDETHFTGCDISPCLFEMICRIRGIENAIMDLAAEPDMARSLLHRAGDFAVKLARAACDSLSLDWLWTGDDVGGQNAMIMSPECWRDLIKPELARIFSVGKESGLWVAYHSCGAMRSIIPDLVEIGLDVLNPIQANCPGMDAAELKAEFGRDLTFMGGVDTHDLLPRADAETVYAETTDLIETMMSDGGGYILAASHTVPPETPMDNIFAMYRAAGMTREEVMDRAADFRTATRS